ncbi:MAG: xanthine dehydrogenase family protein subunit M, partial [Calditrichaeota bacterium]
MEIPYFIPKSFDELDDFLQPIDNDVTYVAGATDIMIHP